MNNIDQESIGNYLDSAIGIITSSLWLSDGDKHLEADQALDNCLGALFDAHDDDGDAIEIALDAMPVNLIQSVIRDKLALLSAESLLDESEGVIRVDQDIIDQGIASGEIEELTGEQVRRKLGMVGS